MTAPPAYIPGLPPIEHGPLWRYLAPIPNGVGSAWLQANLPRGSWVLDPFGAAPRLSAEAARGGYRVLAAAHNPIARFLLELHANPPSESELRSALADLAAAPRAGERIEPHIRALYLTECAQCGRMVEAQAFIWEREAPTPAGRIYHCPHCKDGGERPALPGDAQRAAQFAAGGLHRARALERVAPMDDPDRAHAEEALGMYLPRAVYALFTLVNKLESFPLQRRRHLAVLLLAVFDQANVMWHYPPERTRPRQLSIPPRFLEKNIWLSLEEAVQAWSSNLALQPGEAALPLSTWPNEPPAEGGLCLYEGRLKDLADQVKDQQAKGLGAGAVLAALPRPNQAYWTLSALWAGWLWGHQASEPFHSVLRRRRYDWSWHTVALHASFRSLAQVLAPGTPCLGLVGEAEPGFLSAAAVSAELAGFELEGMALRAENNQAQIHWRRGESETQSLAPANLPPAKELQETALRAAQDYLRKRGEPASYLSLHTASLTAIAQEHTLAAGQEAPTAEILHQIEEALSVAFSYRAGFSRYAGSGRSLEVGQWWLNEAGLRLQHKDIEAPLADRVEMEVVRHLHKHPGCTTPQVDQALCAAFPGVMTPELELVEECLRAYGEQEGMAWQLRPQDEPKARRADLAAMKNLLELIGNRVGYKVIYPQTEESSTADVNNEPMAWLADDGRQAYTIYLLASAVLGKVALAAYRPASYEAERSGKGATRNLIVLPGGRAGLVDYKVRHDPRLRSAIEAGWRFVKFRHVRWLAEYENLRQDNLEELLERDPLANRDPQMALL